MIVGKCIHCGEQIDHDIKTNKIAGHNNIEYEIAVHTKCDNAIAFTLTDHNKSEVFITRFTDGKMFALKG